MKIPFRKWRWLAGVAAVSALLPALAAGAAGDVEAAVAKSPLPSLRAMLVTGGCCHNYPFQTAQLTNAVARHARVQWTIVQEGGTGTRAQIPLYDDPAWAAGQDVVVHNECFADTRDPEYIRKITDAHRGGVPAVVIHCAVHTYRDAAIDDWREFLGVQSRRHEHQSRYPVKVLEPVHPVLATMPSDWVTPMDELYVIDRVWPNVTVLATSASERNGAEHPVIWINQFGNARVFGTTYGHSDDTFRDPIFLELVSRGLLWSAGKLE